jgi:hypothetical protein
MNIHQKTSFAFALVSMTLGLAGVAEAQPVPVPGDTAGCESANGPFAWSCFAGDPGV